MSVKTLDPDVARWMADIATALTNIGDCTKSWGNFYVSEVSISFDGEEVEMRIAPADADGAYEIVLGT